ncbi:AAA domain-containing protein [Lipomyces arxii]|uniref:AAA domain-containing protein n=1 Tax=Lipomyces arxii TaxID=56418 RepID=UPI0034CE8E6E
MSTIQRLAIQGVRSFDSARRETIYFEVPLTLIVGHNGSGKTTIVECLRYATTGDLPPNSKGGAFIHDPKIANETEVLAQVKLGFTSTNGQAMICTRSMQVTMKKNNSRVFKTLEAQLVVNGDKRSNISTRCAELDTLMPQLLGVYKAILDYVVFCHQDDSLWPLSEPAALKKKFDEIFEALKYTKALDACKAIKKERSDQVKLLERDVQHISSDKSKADRLRTSTDELILNIAQFKEDAEQINAEMEQVDAELQARFQSRQDFQAVLSQLEQHKSTLTSLDEQRHTLEISLVELDETDEMLFEKLSRFEQHTNQQRAALDALKESLNFTRAQLSQAKAKHENALIEEGRLNAEAEAHVARLARRETVAKHISSQHNIPGYDMELDDLQVEEFRAKLKEAVRARTNRVQEVKDAAETDLGKIRSFIQDLRDGKSNFEVKLSLYKNTNTKRADDIHQLQGQIDTVMVDESDIAYDEEKYNSMIEKLKEATEAFDKRDFATIQTEKAKLLQSEEQRLEAINAEFSLSNTRADMRAKIGLLKDEVSKREKVKVMLVSVNKDKFLQLTGSALESSQFETFYKDSVESVHVKLDEATKIQEGTLRELSKIETRYSLAKAVLQKQKEEMSSLKKTYEDFFGANTDMNEYEQELQGLAGDLTSQRAEYEQRKFIEMYLKQAIADAAKAHRCSLCHQSIRYDSDESDDEGALPFKDFEIIVKERLSKLTDSDWQLATIKEAEDDYDQANAIGKHVAKYRELDSAMPESERELEKLLDELNTARKQSEQSTWNVDGLKQELQQLEALRRPVSDILRTTRELSDLELEIAEYTSQLNDSGSGRSLEEIENDRQAVTNTISQLRKELTKILEEKERSRNLISGLENQMRDRKIALNKKVADLQSKHDLVNRVEMIQREIEETKSQMEILYKRLGIANTDLEAQSEILKTTREHFARSEAEALKNASVLSNCLNEFEIIHAEIRRYVESDRSERLQRAQSTTAKYDVAVRELSITLERDNEIANQMERQLANTGSQQRQIQDNIQLRKVRRKIESLKQTIIELGRQNADVEKRKYDDDISRLRGKLNQLNAEYGGKLGGIKQMQDQVQRAEKEMSTEFRDVHMQYREKRLELKLLIAAVADISVFMKSLDSAIMQYHSLKMEEINRIIDELWKKTYSGTDVDTIMIRSDDESEKANRSYNYRVCMVKQDVELDMRGRCSAGQKVLASIIIRLALAECFGVNCGIIALDEPTTNLDEENVQSLARSLGSIIEARSAQKNFQLIVITHDENFLRYMSGSKYCEHYFRVSRDERQKSQIELQKISEVF